MTPWLQHAVVCRSKWSYSFGRKTRFVIFDPSLPRLTIQKLQKHAFHSNEENCDETNWNKIKNTQKGIKSLISLKTVVSSAPTVLSHDDSDTITNPYDIANTFNNYFASISETTKSNIKYSHKHFPGYLKEECESTIFLKPTSI